MAASPLTFTPAVCGDLCQMQSALDVRSLAWVICHLSSDPSFVPVYLTFEDIDLKVRGVVWAEQEIERLARIAHQIGEDPDIGAAPVRTTVMPPLTSLTGAADEIAWAQMVSWE